MKIMIGFIFAVLIAGAVHSCATAHEAAAGVKAYYPALVQGRYMAVLAATTAQGCSDTVRSTIGSDDVDAMCLSEDQLALVVERYKCTIGIEDRAYACLGIVRFPS